MPYFISTDKKSRTCAFWSTYLHGDLLHATLQKRCDLKIGCKFGRECKLAISATLGPRRSVNTASRGAILTFWHPSELLPQATPHTRSGWNGGDGVQESQSFPLILLKEEEFIYPQSVEQLTLCYWSVLENEERTGRKDPTWSVGAFLSSWWRKLTVLCSNTYVFCSQAQTPAGSQGFLSDLRTLKHCLTLKTSEYLPLWVAPLNKMPLKKEVNFWEEN